MAFFNRQNTYTQDKPILAFPSDVSYTRSAQIRKETLSTDTDGKVTLQAGTFIARYYDTSAAKDLFRPLPRVELAEELEDGVTTTFAVKNNYSQVLLPGDVLYVVEPYDSFLMVAGAGATASIDVDGRVVSFTTTETAVADVAAETAAYFNDAPYVSDKYYFASDAAGNVLIFSRDGVSEYTGDATVGAAWDTAGAIATEVAATAVGTVSSISTSDAKVTLAAASNAGFNIPIGTHLGVTNIKEIYGLYPYSIDFTSFKTTYDVGLVSEAQVYLGALPYYDGNIKYQLPEIDAKLRF